MSQKNHDISTSSPYNPSTCFICKVCSSKYTCPRCSRNTCSLTCCLKHKEMFDCNGKKPSESSMFLSLNRMTDSTLLSDYQFLEKVEQSQRSGARLVRDLGCETPNISRGKKRRKGHDIEQQQIIQPLLMTTNKFAASSEKIQPSSSTSSSNRYNSDEIQLDMNCMYPTSPMPLPSAVKLDSTEGDYDNSVDQGNILQVLNIVPKTEVYDPYESPSSSILLQTNNTNTSSHNLNLITSKDWLTKYPPHLQRLVEDAQRYCQINLLLMPVGMQRRILNKDTRYDFKRKGMVWGRIEYIFHLFEPKKIERTMVDCKTVITLENIHDSNPVHENIQSILNQNLSHSGFNSLDAQGRNVLKAFCTSTAEQTASSPASTFFLRNDVCVVMKKIPCKASEPKFIQLRITSDTTLRECLKQTTIIEYPTLEVVLKNNVHHFPCLIEDAD